VIQRPKPLENGRFSLYDAINRRRPEGAIFWMIVKTLRIKVHDLHLGYHSLITHKGRKPVCKQAVLGLFLSLFILGSALPAAAHGGAGTLQIAAEPVGAYQLNVWTTPEVLRPGEMLIAAVITTDVGAPVLNCHVTYFLRTLGSEERQERPATHVTVVTGFSYEAIFLIPDPGAYLIEIEIAAPDGAQTVTGFEVEITAVSKTTGLAIHTAVMATLVLCVWFVREALRFWLPRLVRHQTL
jgi:hypothetical protein